MLIEAISRDADNLSALIPALLEGVAFLAEQIHDDPPTALDEHFRAYLEMYNEHQS